MNMKLLGFVALFVVLLSPLVSAQQPRMLYKGYVDISGFILSDIAVSAEVNDMQIASATVPSIPSLPGSYILLIPIEYAGSNAKFKINGVVAYEVTLDSACSESGGCNPNLTVDDTVSPTITGVSATPNTGTARVSVTIEATVTDTFGVSSVEARIQKPDGNVVTVTMNPVSGNVYEGTLGTTGMADGTYLIDINATDHVGNSRLVDNGAVVGLGAGSAFTNNSVSISGGNTKTIDAESEAGVTLDISTNSTVNGSVNIVEYTSTPSIGGSISAMGKYIDIELSQDIKDSLEWIMVRIHYTDAEVAAMGVSESNLAIYWWNETASQWVKLEKDNPSWVNDAGVDTTANYIWANVSHLSSYTGGGQPTCSDGIQNQGETGVDCGGANCPSCPTHGGGGALPLCEENWICTAWSACMPGGTQTRTCTDENRCGTNTTKPTETIACTYYPPAYCGDGTCQATESCSTCPTDCGACPPVPPTGPVCGNGVCEAGETCSNCAADCGACPPPVSPPPITGMFVGLTQNPVFALIILVGVIVLALLINKFGVISRFYPKKKK